MSNSWQWNKVLPSLEGKKREIFMRVTLVLYVLLLLGTIANGSARPEDKSDEIPSSSHEDKSVHGEGASIAIQAIQGTEGGPKISGDTAIVELFGKGGRLQAIEVQLDEHGLATLESLPLLTSFLPRVTVKHAGAEYEKIGHVMDATHPHQKISVTVYETTEQRPNWEVQMWHVMLHSSEEGLHVTEMLVVQNPTDRAWLPAPNILGDRHWVVRNLPKGAQGIKMGGALHSHSAKVKDGSVMSTEPMTPGTSKFRVGHVLSTSTGQANVTLEAPAPVKHLMIFVPYDQPELHNDDLELIDVMEIHEKPMRSYKTAGL